VRTEMGELRAARQSALSVPRLGEGLARVRDDLQRQLDAASAALNTQAETLRAAAAEDRAALQKALATDVQRAVRCVIHLQRAPLATLSRRWGSVRDGRSLRRVVSQVD
jgi:ABC-type transporter Mla subunit MlaD